MNLSMTKAALAIYPTSSRKAMTAKNMSNMGSKVKTDPTPPMTPSMMIPLTQG